MGLPGIFDDLLKELEGNDTTKGHEKIYRTEEAYETYLLKMMFQINLHIQLSLLTFPQFWSLF